MLATLMLSPTPSLQPRASLAPYTTRWVGGSAKGFWEATALELKPLAHCQRRGAPSFYLGREADMLEREVRYPPQDALRP